MLQEHIVLGLKPPIYGLHASNAIQSDLQLR